MTSLFAPLPSRLVNLVRINGHVTSYIYNADGTMRCVWPVNNDEGIEVD